MMQRLPIFIVLFAAYPVLYAAVRNPGQVSAFGVSIALLAVVIALAILLPCAWRLTSRSWQRASLAALPVILLFWSFGLLEKVEMTLYEGALTNSASILRYGLLLICLLLIAAACIRIRRIEPPHLKQCTTALNFAAVVLLAALGIQWLLNKNPLPLNLRAGIDREITTAGTPTPDIYYIVLDGYARADVLEQHYGLDNPLPGELRDRGFFVAAESTANYNWTFLSLASSLNMDYLQSFMGDRLKPEGADRRAPYQAIQDSVVSRFLRNRGYRFIHFRSSWGATLSNPYADEEVSCTDGTFQDEFLRVLIDATWLRLMSAHVASDLAECHTKQFRALSEIGAARGPKLVFAHFILPHHPYLFARDGAILRHATLSSQFEFQKHLWEDKASYVEQLLHVNRQILNTIDRIIESSALPPIIVLQSDHGPNLQQGLSDTEQRHVRFANLAAFRLPDAPSNLIPPDVAAVNQFRLIFNHYFDAGMDILPTRNYYSAYRTPYRFELQETPLAAGERMGTETATISNFSTEPR